MMKNTLYMVCFLWARRIRVLDKCILTLRAVHSHSFAQLPDLHGAEDPMVVLSLSPMHLIRESTGIEESQHLVPWVYEPQSRPVKVKGARDPENIQPL